MNNGTLSHRPSLRLSAWLLLVGQVLYIAVTLFHADGRANDHAAAFAEYASNGIWTAVHLGQFASMAVLLAGLALLLLAAALVRTAWMPRPIAYLSGLSSFTYLVQGWVVGSEGFSQTETIAIVVAYILDLAWMIWLVAAASRMQDSQWRSPGR